MKNGRHPGRTRARILAAAMSEFAHHGLGGARVDRIARRAGANKRMLYYYSGSKEARSRRWSGRMMARTVHPAVRIPPG